MTTPTKQDQADYPVILKTAAGVFIALTTGYLLIIADGLLIPLVFAILIWYLLNTMDHTLSHISVKGWRPPRWLRLFLALALLTIILNMVAGIVATSVSRVFRDAPQYQNTLEQMLRNLPFGIELSDIPALARLTTEFDIGFWMQIIAWEIGGLLGNIGLIAVYLIFLFLEQRHFSEKLRLAAGRDSRHRQITSIIAQIDRDIRRYIGVKTMLSFVTALGAWIIMKWVGLDFAGFWALLIFMFNYIPNIGSIAATTMPALFSLLQFETYSPFFIILFGVGALQVIIGNILDPFLMGKSLNVSPLVIIFSLVFWGVIWGLPGMFLCVPITVILMIILYNFENTRWIAMMLSRDGQQYKG